MMASRSHTLYIGIAGDPKKRVFTHSWRHIVIPKFALTRATKPADLKTGERSIVFEALKPYPEVVSLVELVDRCIKHGFAERKRKHNPPPLSYLWESVLNQIRALKELGLVQEE